MTLKTKIKNKINYYSKKIGIDLNYFIKGSFWNSLNQLVNVTLGMILSVFLARFTTQDVLGNYNFIISIMSMLSIIAMPGLNVSLMKSVSNKKDGVYVRSFRLSFLWSLIGVPMLLVMGLYYYFESNMVVVGICLLLAAIFFPLFYAPNNWQYLLQGKKRFDILSKSSIIQTFIRTLAVILAVIIGKGSLIPIVIAFLISNSLFNIFYYYKYKRLVKNDLEDEDWKKTGYKLTFVEFTLIAYDNIDRIFIGILLGPAQLAIYVIAVSIINLIRGSFSQIFRVFTPKILEMKKELICYNLKKFMPWFIISNIGLVILLFIVIPLIITLLYSEKYVESIFYAQIYLITIPLAFIMSITNTALIAIRKENALLRIRIIGTIIILFLYFILIPVFGICGAILSSIIYYLILDILQYIYIFK